MNDYPLEFRNLLIALALGLLIGLQRGWTERGGEEGSRVAGIRTFGLISLLGALWQLLSAAHGPLTLAVAFGAFALLIVAGAVLEIRGKNNYSITTPVAALVAFALGALAMAGHLALAAAASVLTTVLLGLKPVLHGWLRRLEPRELNATFMLLLISVVLLPVLPDRTFDPWQALNPYKIWWMVVLISAISFSGYFAIKTVGAGRGILLTGLFAGLASSTAATLSLSRLAKKHPALHRLAAAGVCAASATMFVRMLLVVGFVQPALLKPLAAPLLAMAGVGYLSLYWQLRGCCDELEEEAMLLVNPFEFGVALRFGALLAVILLLTRVLADRYGSAGLYLLAGISGMSDVDAITLSIAPLAGESLGMDTATYAIVLASAANTLVKGLLAAFIAGGTMARVVGGVFTLSILAGAAALAVNELI
ncbi:MAG TPA: MgtC/SapB family protein [Methylococcaceae bacterium]|nr:MgtC/SapB family protein [Methylococcaceae bacterium]